VLPGGRVGQILFAVVALIIVLSLILTAIEFPF
jgi:hypothetical protein